MRFMVIEKKGKLYLNAISHVLVCLTHCLTCTKRAFILLVKYIFLVHCVKYANCEVGRNEKKLSQAEILRKPSATLDCYFSLDSSLT